MPAAVLPRAALLLATGLFLAACSTADITEYQERQPRLVPEEFFRGPLTAHGIVKDRSGRVTRTFNAELTGSWQDGEGLLEERFVFDDGEVQFRDWKLVPSATDNRGVRNFTGYAGDVVGPARVRVSGNAMFIRYTLQVPWKGDTIEVAVDDRMYLVSDRVLINESRLSKWGFDVGEVVLTIIRGQRP
ncbi:DUF3833 domain-containing protein [Microbulbifer yueqingensis]|uniref:Lipoprotein n=1 Tax=Microbulbifer yueqingensis TaxID=658219 RepID=A0A1G9D1Y0_9GAMM|nr:DUF3833 domain-containing protein [Microbulbifer yueqingensis]SDK57940.1 Protein of unknown function [Microbulbifer yueqingensis]